MFSAKTFLTAIAATLFSFSMPSFAALTDAQAQAIVNDPNRTADAELDLRRHPAQLLIFTGVEPGMRVGDFDAGGAWTTELLGRAVGSEGVIYSRANPNRLEALQQRLALPGLEHAVAVGHDMTSAFPPEATDLDLVIGLFAFHHLVMRPEDERAAAYANVMGALKPGGYFIVSDTQALEGAPASTGGTLHRMDPGLMRSELESAGFVFVEASNILQNPNDPLDIATRDVEGVASGFLHKYMKPE
jgi:predicted methyltransferase